MVSFSSMDGTIIKDGTPATVITINPHEECVPYINGKPVLPPKRFALRDYFEKTTVHGLSDWYNAESWAGKVIWLLLLMTMLGFLTYGIVTSAKQFYENPVITSMRINIDIPKALPDVYICPAQPIDVDAFKAANETARSTIHCIFKFEQMLTQFFAHNQTWFFTPSVVESVDFDLQKFMSLISRIAYPAKQLFAWCGDTAGEGNCSSPVLTIINPVGLCYHLRNLGFQYIPETGINMMIKIPAFMSLNFGKGFPRQFFDGVLVGVAPRNEDAVGLSSHWMVKGGSFAALRLSQVNRQLINMGQTFKQFNKCRKHAASQDFQMLNVSTYTRHSCVHECILHLTVTEYNCVLPLKPSFVKSGYASGYKVCTASYLRDRIQASLKRNSSIIDGARQCVRDCDYPCVQTEYTGTLTSQDFYAPIDDSTMSTESTAVNGLPNRTGSLSTKNDKYQYIMLDIAFTSLETTEITETASITASSFMSNIGGHFGLWIGASLMTIAQFIVFCCGGLLQMWHDRGRKRRLARKASTVAGLQP